MTKTAMIVTGTVVTLGIYDLVTVVVSGEGTSISRMLQNAGMDAPFVTFTLGFICGHIFGYMPPRER